MATMEALRLDPLALDESLGTARHALDLQVQGSHQQFARAEAFLRLGIAEAGGIAALAGFLLTQSVPLAMVWVTLLGCSVMANFIAVALSAAVGSLAGPKWLATGPDLGRLEQAVLIERSGVVELKVNLLHCFMLSAQRNHEILADREARLALALVFLLASGATLLGALAYISGVAIFA